MRYRHQLKSGKAKGLDDINPEHIKHAPEKLDFHYSMLFRAILRHSFLPLKFMSVRIVPIVKSATGSISSSDNYRPVAIATASSKVLEIAILDKVQKLTECPSANQFGFRRGSSTDQCIFLLKERIRRYVQQGGPVYCCFLDASKAFDRVCHSTLFLRLLDLRIPTSIIRLVRYWYAHQEMVVCWGGCSSSGFGTRNGVRQGGVLSPALFNVYVDLFSNALNKSEVGCHLNAVSINHLFYADDLCLLSPSLAGLRLLVNICENVADFLSIKFNVKKSVYVRFLPKHYRDIPHFDVMLNDTPIPLKNEANYLGHIISGDLSDGADMRRAIRSLYARGNSLVHKFHSCSELVKVALFRAYITPIYGCHLWVGFSQRQNNEVKVAYNAIFRKFFSLNRMSSISQNLIRLHLPTIPEIIRKLTSSLYHRFKSASNQISADVWHLAACFSSLTENFWSRLFPVRAV